MAELTNFDNLKKRTAVEKLKSTLGNITAACDAAEISRQTFYNWFKADEDFAAAVHDVEEMSLDFAESALKQQMREGNMTAVIFYLKTKGKKRGYVERQEVAVSGKTPEEAAAEFMKLTDK